MPALQSLSELHSGGLTTGLATRPTTLLSTVDL